MPSKIVPSEAYRELFEHSLDAVLLTVPDGRIVAANQAAPPPKKKCFGFHEK